MSFANVLSQFEVEARKGTDMVEHMQTIRHYSSQCPVSVEFGVYDCTSTWALLAGNPQKLTSYDVVRRVEVDLVEQLTKAAGINFRFVLANTVEITLEPCDLLFIDSYHSYDHLKLELNLHAACVRQFILMHDTTTFATSDQDYTGRGLWPAIEEFLAANLVWKIKERFTNCHGLTVLERK